MNQHFFSCLVRQQRDRAMIVRTITCVWVAALVATCGQAIAIRAEEPAIVRADWIYDEAPFPECHASTLEIGRAHV